jgi:uncharacterized protein
MNKPKVDGQERRGVRIELRADGEGEAPKLRGHAAVFNSPSELMGGCFREIILPGAFADSLQESDIRALVNHDSRMVLGRSSAGTLRVSEDETGLAIEIDPPDTSYARDLIISMQRGDISEMSFAFTVAEDGQEWTRDPDESGNWTRTISKFSRIYDVSPVTYPAYPETDCALRTLETVKAKDAAPPVDGDEIVMRRLRLELEAAS